MRNFRKLNINIIKKTAKLFYCLAVSFCILNFVSEAYCAFVLSNAVINTFSDYGSFFDASVVEAALPSLDSDNGYLLIMNSESFSSPIYLNFKYNSEPPEVYGSISTNDRNEKNGTLYVYAGKSGIGISGDNQNFHMVSYENLKASPFFSSNKFTKSIGEYAAVFKSAGAAVGAAYACACDCKSRELLKSLAMQSYGFSRSGNEISFKLRSKDLKAKIPDFADFIDDGNFVFSFNISDNKIRSATVLTSPINSISYGIKLNFNATGFNAEISNIKKRQQIAVFNTNVQKDRVHMGFENRSPELNISIDADCANSSLSVDFGSKTMPHISFFGSGAGERYYARISTGKKPLLLTLSKSKIPLQKPSSFAPASHMSIGELSAMGEVFLAIKRCVG